MSGSQSDLPQLLRDLNVAPQAHSSLIHPSSECETSDIGIRIHELLSEFLPDYKRPRPICPGGSGHTRSPTNYEDLHMALCDLFRTFSEQPSRENVNTRATSEEEIPAHRPYSTHFRAPLETGMKDGDLQENLCGAPDELLVKTEPDEGMCQRQGDTEHEYDHMPFALRRRIRESPSKEECNGGRTIREDIPPHSLRGSSCRSPSINSNASEEWVYDFTPFGLCSTVAKSPSKKEVGGIRSLVEGNTTH